MTDETTDQNQPAGAPSSSPEPASVTQSARAVLTRRDAKGRPIAVYGILGAAVLALFLLMIIVYFSSPDRTPSDEKICTSIDPDRAQVAVRDGNVGRLIVGFDNTVQAAIDPMWGPVLARVDYVDGQCANLPQGVTNQADIMAILGTIAFYNQTTDSAQIEVIYNQMTNLDPVLYETPTEPPTPTATAIPTEPPLESPQVTEVPIEAPTGTPATPEATPATPVAGTPVTSPTVSPESPPGTP